MTIRALALTRYDRLGASSRVRVLQYIPHLADMGVQTTVAPLLSDADLSRLYKDGRRSFPSLISSFTRRLRAILTHRPIDIIWLQQEIFPFLPFFAEVLLLAGKKVIVDYDDANHLYYEGLRSVVGRAVYGEKIKKIMRRADAVVVGNPVMETYARSAGARHVHLVHSAVDTRTFGPTAPLGPFTVGWIGTPMTAAQSFPLIQEPLRRFLNETQAPAHYIGMEANQFPDLPGRRMPWREDDEAKVLAHLSLGLCPLDDTPWTRGKSGYKLIQYMAAGRAALTSPVGIAADIVEDGLTGFHCATPEHWYQRLMDLYRDPQLLARQGQRGREIAVERYDVRVAAQQLYEVFSRCAYD